MAPPLLLPLLLAAAAFCTGAEAALRGLDPALAEHYSGKGGTFRCLDGSKTVPFERVNDDYCDCSDGSDEPGTSACHNGKFYCVNKGHEPRQLSATFVDDGVCDCCDGTDEKSGCTNTCLEKHAETKQRLQAEIDESARALARRAEYLAQAKGKRGEWQTRLQGIDAEIAAKQAEVAELEKKAAEEATERTRRAAEREAKAAEERAAAEKAAEERAAAEHAAAWQQQQQEGSEGTQGAESVPHEETPEERGRRIAAQWTHDPEAAGVPAPHSDHEHVDGEHDAGAEEEHYHADHDHDHHDHDHDHEHDHDHDHDHGHGHYEAQEDSFVDELDPSSPSSAAYQLKEAKKVALELQLEKANMHLWLHPSVDMGPGDMFAALAGRCFTDHGPRFNYEACILGQATQSEPHNPSNKVNLGRWKGFTADYKTAVFSDGDPCAAPHPARSFRIHLVCSELEQLYESSEPDVCSYQAYFATPLACSEQDHQAVVEKLTAHEAWEAQILEEIRQEEERKAHPPSVKDEL